MGLCLRIALFCSPQASSQPYVGMKSIPLHVLVSFRGESRGKCSEGAEVCFSRSPDVGHVEPGAQGALHPPSSALA